MFPRSQGAGDMEAVDMAAAVKGEGKEEPELWC